MLTSSGVESGKAEQGICEPLTSPSTAQFPHERIPYDFRNSITGRYYQTATLLTNGEVLLAGGVDSSGFATFEAELFDLSTGTFNGTGSLLAGRYQHIATRLLNGSVLVTGGFGAGGQLASAEL